MCAEEFTSFLDNSRKALIEEKLSAFGDIVEKVVQILLTIPDLVDLSLQDLNSKVTNLQNQLTAINQDISTLKSDDRAVSSLLDTPNQEVEHKLYCKHCSSKLQEGQTICHVCGKMVI